MIKLIFYAIFLLYPVLTYAQDAKEILKKAEDAIKGETSKGDFAMKVVRPEYTREMSMKSWWDSRDDKALIEITAPPKDKGNKTLKIGDEMWNYLKNTETTMKIPPSMMMRSWNGSDLTNDDIVRESDLVEDYKTTLMFEEKIGGEMCWKLKLIPKSSAAVVWGKIYYWVRKNDFLPALIQYYDEKGRLIRTMKFRGYKMMDNRKIPAKWIVESNTKENHYTVFIYEDVEFNVDIPERIFSFRQLER